MGLTLYERIISPTKVYGWQFSRGRKPRYLPFYLFILFINFRDINMGSKGMCWLRAWHARHKEIRMYLFLERNALLLLFTIKCRSIPTSISVIIVYFCLIFIFSNFVVEFVGKTRNILFKKKKNNLIFWRNHENGPKKSEKIVQY